MKTVNLAELATGFRGHGKTESNYKRLQRFFRRFDLDYKRDRENHNRVDGHPSTLDFKYRQNRMVVIAQLVSIF